MTVRFTGFDVRELFSHALLWGAAAIAEDAGVATVRMSWPDPGLSPVAQLDGGGLDEDELARVVRRHAAARASTGTWIDEPFPLEPERGLFSPRVKRMGEDPTVWEQFERARHAALDRAAGSLLDLRLIGALGEPSWWVRSRGGPGLDQDAGASRLEMQPRNRGSEFVVSRLRPLTKTVAARPAPDIAAGLAGSVVRDDMGRNASDSRTATNLRPLGPTDDAAGYVALWGITSTALVHRRQGASATSTSVPLGAVVPKAFVVPVWRGSWTCARLRSVLASDALAVAGGSPGDDNPGRRTAAKWLHEHGVRGLIRTPVDVSGSPSAPERRATTGHVVALEQALSR